MMDYPGLEADIAGLTVEALAAARATIQATADRAAASQEKILAAFSAITAAERLAAAPEDDDDDNAPLLRRGLRGKQQQQRKRLRTIGADDSEVLARPLKSARTVPTLPKATKPRAPQPRPSGTMPPKAARVSVVGNGAAAVHARPLAVLARKRQLVVKPNAKRPVAKVAKTAQTHGGKALESLTHTPPTLGTTATASTTASALPPKPKPAGRSRIPKKSTHLVDDAFEDHPQFRQVFSSSSSSSVMRVHKAPRAASLPTTKLTEIHHTSSISISTSPTSTTTTTTTTTTTALPLAHAHRHASPLNNQPSSPLEAEEEEEEEAIEVAAAQAQQQPPPPLPPPPLTSTPALVPSPPHPPPPPRASLSVAQRKARRAARKGPPVPVKPFDLTNPRSTVWPPIGHGATRDERFRFPHTATTFFALAPTDLLAYYSHYRLNSEAVVRSE